MKNLIMLMVLIVGSWVIYPSAKQEVLNVYGKVHNLIEQEKFKHKLPLHKVVKIHFKGGFCSGFKTTSGLVITAKHCVSDKMFIVSSKQEKDLSFDTYSLFQESQDKDLAILSKTTNVEENNKLLLQTHKSGELRTSSVKIGEKLFILGTNGDEPISQMVIRTFIVERIMFIFSKAIWGTSFNIEGGTSGSGVVDKDGKLVGVLSFVKNDSPEAGITSILK